MRYITVLLTTALALFGAGCGASEPEGAERAAITPPEGIADRMVRVTTTTNIVTDMVRDLGGERVEVTGLMGPGVDPHLYKASASDVDKLRDADLMVYIGRDLEGRMADVLEEVSTRRPGVAVAEGIDETELLDAAEGQGNYEYDPHVWFDPDLWADAAREAAKALQEIDPDSADYYEANLSEYLAMLSELATWSQTSLDSVPEETRVVVTSHDAFRYFGRRFGYEVAGIQGTSTATEATTDDIDRVATLIADRKLAAIFVESSVPQQTIDAVIDAAGALGQETEVGGELYSDSAGDEGTPEGTYEGMFRHNVESIAMGLGGEVSDTE